jgi:predicted nucleic acid-binding Zn ribbon protein
MKKQPQRPKMKNPDAIGNILRKVFGANQKIGQKIRQYRLWAEWERLVGSQLASKARPLRVQGTTLLIGATSHSWVQELTMMRPQLLAKVHEVIDPGIITEIRVTLLR